jgi:hypothetical protein
MNKVHHLKRMMKLGVFWSSLLISAFASVSAYAQWDFYHSDEISSSYYEISRVTKENGTIFVASRTDYQYPQALRGKDAPVGLYSSLIETVFFDCKKKVFTVPDLTYHASKDLGSKVVHWVSLSPSQFKWQSISKDKNKSNLFKNLESACKT